MSAAANPFRPAERARLRVKCLVYGASGIGKTYFALSAPGPVAVIDTEGGTAFYAGRTGLSTFDVLPTKTFGQVEQAVAYIRANPAAYATLVIDPVTVLYQVLQDAAQHRRAEIRRDPDADMEQLDWQRVKRAYQRLMNDLVNLPMHVIVTAREADMTEERIGANGKKERVKIGFRPEAEKGTAYHFDTVLRFVVGAKGREVVVEKDRTDGHQLGAKVVGPTFDSIFSGVLAGPDTGAERSVPSDEDAARADAATTMRAEQAPEKAAEPTYVSQGQKTYTGVVKKGDGQFNDVEYHQDPDGHRIGFRLDIEGGNAIHEVLVTGALGEAMRTAVTPAELLGATVSVEGEAFRIDQQGRRPRARLVVSSITSEAFKVPAPEAASIPLFESAEKAELESLVW